MPQCVRTRYRNDRYHKNPYQGPKSLVASGFSTLICGVILLLIGFCIFYFSTPNGEHLSLRGEFGNFKFGDSPDNHRKIMQSIGLIMMAFGGCLVAAGIVVAACGAVKSKNALPETQSQQPSPYTIDMNEQSQTCAQPQLPVEDSPPPPSYNNTLEERPETDPSQPVLAGYPVPRATFAQPPPSAPSDGQPWNPERMKSGDLFVYSNGGLSAAYDAFPGRRLYPQLEPLSNPSGNGIYTVDGQPQLGLQPSSTVLPGQFHPYMGVGGNNNYSDMTENGHRLGTPGNQRF